jgi:hypothetical protein
MTKGNRYKAQGTTFERKLRLQLTSRRIANTRLAEEGSNDEGDILINDLNWVVEARHRGVMNIHQAVADASRKAQRLAHAGTVVIWKRSQRKPGARIRTQVGVPVACMSVSDFYELVELALIGREKALGETKPI